MQARNLNKMSLVVSGHHHMFGPLEALVEYLRTRPVRKMVVLYHPLLTYDIKKGDLNSEIWEYNSGIKSYYKKIKTFDSKPIVYVQHLVTSIVMIMFFSLKRKSRFNFFIGFNTLNALAGIILKKLKIVDKVCFCSQSYHFKYSENPIVNRLYWLIELYCSNEADIIWNGSPRLAQRRERLFPRSEGKNLVVLNGVSFNHKGIVARKILDINRPTVFVFTGHLSKRSGIELVVGALPILVKNFPQIKVLIIGDGPLRNSINDFVNKNDLKNNVEILGFVEHEKVLEILPNCDVGLATYDPSTLADEWAADPIKVREYLSCGLPVIVTNVAWTQDLISKVESYKAGFGIEYNKSALINAVRNLLSEKKLLEIYKKNAEKLAAKNNFWSWNGIFDEAFDRTFAILSRDKV